MRLRQRLMVLSLIVSPLVGCSSDLHPDPRGRVYVVFFEEFSADISPEAHTIVDAAAAEAKKLHTTMIRVEARANATGSRDATMKIAKTRAAVIRDALLHDGIPSLSIWLVPLGQMQTTDMGVIPRRVTITLEN